MKPPREDDPRVRAVREILRYAQEDRRRGVEFWFDPALPDALRHLVREAASGEEAPPAESSPAVAPATPPSRSAPEEIAEMKPKSSQIPPAVTPARAGGATRPQWGPPPEATGRESDWKEKLAAVALEAAACTACGLCQTRRNVVYGTGSGLVPLVFVGEAPGADEDRQGFPFVGRAGQLLTKIIEAIGLPREDVYICNVLKCRPPQNRNPAPDEIAACASFLERQLAILRPKVVCTLGLFATQRILETTAPIGKLRGRVFQHAGLTVLPTYHPAALLRNPNLKAIVWEDVKLLRKILDE